MEVLNVDGTNYYCTLPDFPIERWGFNQDGLTACGGRRAIGVTDNCITLIYGQWTQSHTLLHDRIYHVSWPLGDGRVMLMGGAYNPFTTEIMSPGSSTTTEGFGIRYTV